MVKSVSRLQAAIANATSLAEVERLRGMLQSGQIPGRESRQGNAQGSLLLVFIHLLVKNAVSPKGHLGTKRLSEQERSHLS